MTKENYGNYLVSKDNRLVRGHYDLGLNELKVVLILVSMVQPSDNEFQEYTIKVSQLAEWLQVSAENIYRDLKKITKRLMTQVIEVESEDGDTYLQLTFLSSAEYLKGQGIVKLEFSPKLKPYLLQLQGCYSQYRLQYALNLKSKYAIRLYEICNSHAFENRVFSYTLDEIRKMLQLTQKSYQSYGSLRQKILIPAIDEMTNKTDLIVTFEEEKVGRKVTGVKFTVTKRSERVKSSSRKPRQKKSASKEATPSPVSASAVVIEEESTMEASSSITAAVTLTHELARQQETIKTIKSMTESKLGRIVSDDEVMQLATFYQYDVGLFCENLYVRLSPGVTNPIGLAVDIQKNPEKYKATEATQVKRRESTPDWLVKPEEEAQVELALNADTEPKIDAPPQDSNVLARMQLLQEIILGHKVVDEATLQLILNNKVAEASAVQAAITKISE